MQHDAYKVQVLSRWAGNTLADNSVTAPYSLSLNINSQRSFAANLDSATLKPDAWDHHPLPRLDSPTDSLHPRGKMGIFVLNANIGLDVREEWPRRGDRKSFRFSTAAPAVSAHLPPASNRPVRANGDDTTSQTNPT